MKKFWTKTGKFFSLLLAATTAFTACTDDNEDFRQATDKALDIQVAVKQTSRAMVEGTALPDGAQIGVSVTAANGSGYDGQNVGYLNVPYTATGTGSSQSWGSTNPVMLSGTEGKMYAYFPYTADIDYTAVAVDIADQHDWMYGVEPYSVNDLNPSAEVVMAHAQTALNINVLRDGAYTGAGLVEALTVTSEGLATTGILDTRNGSWSAIDGTNTAVSIISSPFTLDGVLLNSQENPYMFVPAGNGVKGFTITATIDGKSYSNSVTMVEAFTSGKMYKVNVKVTNTGLTVSQVTLTDWVIDTTLPDASLKPEIPVEVVDYSSWVKLTYNVTDASEPVQLFNSQEEEVADVTEMAVLQNGSRASGVPVAATPTKHYTFDIAGEHTVYVKFANMSKIPDFLFSMCTSLSSFELPSTITAIGNSSFMSCKGLKGSLEIPASVITIENAAFNECTNITSLTLGEGLQTIGQSAFQSCTKMESVSMGSRIQNIGEMAFAMCSKLTQINTQTSVAPQLGNFAFYSTAINGMLYVPTGATGYDTWVNSMESGWFIPVEGTIELTTAPNGVYAVAKNGLGVAVADADESCIGVAIKGFGYNFMIAKADATDGTNDTFYWSKSLKGKDISGITEIGKESEAKIDYAGQIITQGIINGYTEHKVEMDSRDMCKVLETFNAGTNSQSNEGFTDWYVPACGQLYVMYTKKADINATLAKIGGTAFEMGTYWSSSENTVSAAWEISFNNGSVYAGNRDWLRQVRFVRDIK